MLIKILKNSFGKEISFDNLEDAKSFYLAPFEELENLSEDELEGKNEIANAENLDELAEALNKNSDNLDNGSTWTVETIGSNIKYEIKKRSIEVLYRNRKDIMEGVTLSCNDGDDELIEVFDEFSLNEAKAKLREFKTDIRKLSGSAGTYYLVEEYYIEINEYDEDDEFIVGGDIVEFSKINIKLIEKPSYEVLGEFDNMEEAENAKNEYDGDYEVFLSF